ncbi:MAG: hypothetical protein HQL54_10120 [Magnetococcales bacterium]|nr:hypothetical protein [Magnetococcales bacterium]
MAVSGLGSGINTLASMYQKMSRQFNSQHNSQDLSLSALKPEQVNPPSTFERVNAIQAAQKMAQHSAPSQENSQFVGGVPSVGVDIYA